MARDLAERFMRSLSGIGPVLGVLFFAAALTPTLVPRTYVIQGILAGAAFASGYLIGVLIRWIWLYLELPAVNEHTRRRLNTVAITASILVALWFLWQATEWQNSIRLLMDMEPLDSGHPFLLSLIAIVT